MNQKVTKYIEKQPSPQKEILEKLRKIILKTVPDLEEEFKLEVPYYGRKCYLVGLKDHVNIGFSLKNLPKEEIDQLEGGGKTTKHIQIASLKEIDKERIEKLLRLV